MHQLLDFLYENSLDKQLYCVLPAPDGELQLAWSAAEPLHWEVRCASAGTVEQVPREALLAQLTARGADLTVLERELGAVVAAHIVVADQLLSAALQAFGSDGVNAVLRGQQQFARELKKALSGMLQPRLRLVR